MGTKVIQTGLAVLIVVCPGALAMVAFAQEAPLSIPHRSPDPNNALIEGRILAPSGQSANFNIKIILSDLNRTLSALYTNKHAEFRFPNLSEGVYYVQAVADEKIYEPATQKLWLGRSQIYQLTITLRKKDEIANRKTRSQVVSASEFDQATTAAARKEYNQAVRLAGRRNAQQAIEHFQRAIAIYADYLDARNDLGAQYLKLKRFDEAAEQFRIALEKNPRYFSSQFNLGLVLIERRNYATAIEQLNRAIAIDSARPAARLWLGVALLQTGDLPGAERELSKALIMGGADLTAAHYYLAQVYLRRGDAAEASRALKAYLEESPEGEYTEESRLLLNKLATGSQEADKLIYADFETAKDNRPVSNRGGLVMLFSYQERQTMPSRYKGLTGANPPAPEFARPSKDDPNKAIAFDFELQGTNQYAGVGVQIHGQPENDGKPVADDVSGYKYLTLRLYATGVSSITVEFVSKGQGIETNGHPQMIFKVTPGFNTYQVPLNSIKQQKWAEPKINPKDALKKLTSINIVATCNQCVPARGTIVVDNLIFQN